MCSLAKGNDIVVTEKCYEICQEGISTKNLSSLTDQIMFVNI